MIPLHEPALDGNEARYLQECIETGYVSSIGPFVKRFEDEFAKWVGAKHAVACSSGTAALHVALRLAGAGPGKLVAVSDFTFIASANAVSYTGADLLLVDSEMETWNMDTEMLYDHVVQQARLGKRIPDIVEIVHILGHPAYVEPLLALRDEFGIKIVEDAAESLGASWKSGAAAGKQVGTIGEFGCFSFNGNKILTCGGGGMIVTDDANLGAKAAHLVTQAKMSGSEYVHDDIGYNYRLTNLAAAIGVAQLEVLPERLRSKFNIACQYEALLGGLPVKTMRAAKWANPSWWLYSILFNSNTIEPNDAILRLRNEGIESRRLWRPLHRQQCFNKTEALIKCNSDSIYQRGASIPSSAHIAESLQIIVTQSIASLFGR